MSTHCNPLTNVTAKAAISRKVKKAMKTTVERVSPPYINDDRSFMEMSLYRIKKYFNEKNNS
jgi:hypothetical protein